MTRRCVVAVERGARRDHVLYTYVRTSETREFWEPAPSLTLTRLVCQAALLTTLPRGVSVSRSSPLRRFQKHLPRCPSGLTAPRRVWTNNPQAGKQHCPRPCRTNTATNRSLQTTESWPRLRAYKYICLHPAMRNDVRQPSPTIQGFSTMV